MTTSLDRYRPWLILNLLPDIGRRRFNTLIRHFAGADGVFKASRDELLEVDGVGDMAARSILHWRDLVDVDREIDRVREHEVSLVCLDDEAYPENLRRTAAPPPLLYFRGDLTEADRAAVAIIGARKMSRYGREVGERISTDLARAGVTVVSGLALGIDSVAHRAALEAGGRTLAVMGQGLSSVYPAQHKHLAEDIASSGAVLSEASMETRPDAGSFPQRNAIIAGLSLGVLVVEAGARSGTSITVGQALDESRSVFAVPGDITRVNSVGANRMIQEGARLVTSARDILVDLHEELRDLIADLPRSDGAPDDEPPPLPAELSDLERAILEILENDTLHIDEITEALAKTEIGQPQQPLAATLLGLELRGLLRQEPGMRFRRVR